MVGDPRLGSENLTAAARRHGAMFLFRRAVTSIRRDGDRVREAVLDGEEQIAAPVVVNAAGPWSSRIDKMAGIDADLTVRLRPLRQEVHSAFSRRRVRNEGLSGTVMC